MSRINSSNWSVNDAIAAARLQDFNEDIDDLYSRGPDRLRVVSAISGTPLRIDIGAGAYRIGSAEGVYAGGTDIVVTDAATNYVELDAGGAVQINTSGFTVPVTRGRLATVVCAAGAITAITLYKPDVVGGSLGAATVLDFTAKTADYSVVQTTDSSKIFTTTGATSPLKFTMPEGVAGEVFEFVATDDHFMLVRAASDVFVMDDEQQYTSIIGFAQHVPIRMYCPKAGFWSISHGNQSRFGRAKGYIIGGNTAANDGGSYVTTADDVDFAAETSAVVTLMASSATHKNTACPSSKSKGYRCGGFAGSSQSTIDLFIFAFETRWTATDTLGVSRQGGGWGASQIRGYVFGGLAGASPSAVISRINFSNDTEDASASVLGTAKRCHGQMCSRTNAYIVGGQDGGGATNVIEKMLLSSEAVSTVTDVLDAAKWCSSSGGMLRGTAFAGNSSGPDNDIETFTYSNETSSLKSTTLGTAKAGNGIAALHGVKAFCGGGEDVGQTTVYTSIADYNYAADTSSVLSGTLDAARQGCEGLQPYAR